MSRMVQGASPLRFTSDRAGRTPLSRCRVLSWHFELGGSACIPPSRLSTTTQAQGCNREASAVVSRRRHRLRQCPTSHTASPTPQARELCRVPRKIVNTARQLHPLPSCRPATRSACTANTAPRRSGLLPSGGACAQRGGAPWPGQQLQGLCRPGGAAAAAGPARGGGAGGAPRLGTQCGGAAVQSVLAGHAGPAPHRRLVPAARGHGPGGGQAGHRWRPRHAPLPQRGRLAGQVGSAVFFRAGLRRVRRRLRRACPQPGCWPCLQAVHAGL